MEGTDTSDARVIARNHSCPPGWDLNPSSLKRRAITIAVTLLALLILPTAPSWLGTMPTAYVLLALTTLIGGTRRWRTTPWVPLLGGGALILAGSNGARLIFTNARDWTTDLRPALAASLSLVLAGPVLAEVLAALQYLRQTQRRGRSAWRALWGLNPRRHHPHSNLGSSS